MTMKRALANKGGNPPPAPGNRRRVLWDEAVYGSRWDEYEGPRSSGREPNLEVRMFVPDLFAARPTCEIVGDAYRDIRT